MTLTFVTGKGGVGKTRISALLAAHDQKLQLAEQGYDLKHEFFRINSPWRGSQRFSRKDLTEEFLFQTLKSKSIAGWAAQSETLQNLFHLAPGLEEILLMQKWIEIAKKNPLLIDAPSSGTFIAHLKSIENASTFFDGGTLREMAERQWNFLQEPTSFHVVIVTTPEASAIAEANELSQFIKNKFKHSSHSLVLNRLHEEASHCSEELKALGMDRPKQEKERIKNLNFEKVILEGASLWPN